MVQLLCNLYKGVPSMQGCARVLFERLDPVVDGIFALLLVAAFLEVYMTYQLFVV